MPRPHPLRHRLRRPTSEGWRGEEAREICYVAAAGVAGREFGECGWVDGAWGRGGGVGGGVGGEMSGTGYACFGWWGEGEL